MKPSVHVTFMGWDDAPHLDAEGKAALAAGYAPHEMGARTRGEPSLGSGAIYPVPYTDVICEPFAVPAYWPRGYGFDVGWNRTAAVFGARDLDADVLYLYAEHYRAAAEPSIHADAIRAHGSWMVGAIDPASRGRGQRDGESLLNDYTQLGLRLVLARNGVESGLLEVWQRLSSGRLKVFNNCQNWIKEYRFYRRDEKGLVVKKADHLMDATRYLCVTGIENMALPPDYLARLGHVPRVHTEYDPYADERIAS